MEHPALDALDLGHHVAVVRKGEKAALHRNFPERWLERDELGWYLRRGFNWGIVLSGEEGLVVGDKDLRKRDADLFVRRMGLFASPMAVRTARGTHYYARLPEGIEARTRLNVRSLGVDLLCGHRIAVGPGSVVGDHRYGLAPGKRLVAPSELPVAREVLVKVLTEREEVKARTEAVTVSELPDDRKIASARNALARRCSIAGRQGDLELFKAACLLIQFYRLGYDLAFRLLIEWNEGPNVQPSWPLDRLEYKLREAQRLMR